MDNESLRTKEVFIENELKDAFQRKSRRAQRARIAVDRGFVGLVDLGIHKNNTTFLPPPCVCLWRFPCAFRELLSYLRFRRCR